MGDETIARAMAGMANKVVNGRRGWLGWNMTVGWVGRTASWPACQAATRLLFSDCGAAKTLPSQPEPTVPK